MKKVMAVVLNNFKYDSRVLKECSSLASYGYSVNVIALHDGISDLPEFEMTGEFYVHRIKLLSKNWSKMALMQLVKYVEFLGRAFWECRTADIIHCNDLNALPVGFFSKLLSLGRIKIIYDAHELETEREGLTGIKKIVSKVGEWSLIECANKVITVSPGIADYYKRLYNIAKPEVVLNAPVFRKYKKTNLLRNDLNIDNGKLIFLYQGVVAECNGIKQIVETFIKSEIEDAVLVIMGYGELEAWVQLMDDNYDNIYFHEAVSPMEVLDYTSSADYGVALLRGDESLSCYYSLANKMFEYAMCQLPIVISNLPEMVAMNGKYGFGVECDYSVEGFMKAIDDIMHRPYEDMSLGAKKMAEDCCWEEQEKILMAIYNSL